MTYEQERVFVRSMESLKNEPLFAPAKRSARNDEKFLVIGCGGAGCRAIRKIRDTLKTYLRAVDYDDYVRILAIDTDRYEQFETAAITRPDGTTASEIRKILEDEEFCFLSGSGVRDALYTDQTVLSQWLNPVIPNMIMCDSHHLDGHCASSTRQLGRLVLYPNSNNSLLRSKINALVGELAYANAAPLNVIVVSGIAGGTGSGLIIDLTYLIRDCIKNLGPVFYNRTKITGMVLLPPTGNSDEPMVIERGNRNGYAALKEINHFMTLRNRNEQYICAYQGKTVTSRDNLFDSCYLFDGGACYVDSHWEGGIAVNNAVAQFILDMITSPSATAGGPASVASILSDAAASATAIFSNTSDRNAPRDADYLYSTLGHCSTEIPLNAMKTYLAYKSYEQMYADFVKCGDVKPDAVEKFYRDVLDTGAPCSAQTNIIGKALMEIFQDKGRGPFYATNLLRAATDFVREQEIKSRLFRIRMADNHKLQQMQEVFLKLYDRYFSVFSAVMETMRETLTEDYSAVINMELQQQGNRRFHSFNPIHLVHLEAGNAVADYLDGLVSLTRVRDLTDSLLAEIIRSREEWSDLVGNDQRDGRFEAPKRIREFWNIQMDRMLSASIEDIVIKWYSGDKNAHFDPQNPGETQPYLDAAARDIIRQMFGPSGKAAPMANLIPNGPVAYEIKCILVPESAPHLMAAIERAEKNAGLRIKVYKSTSPDCITGYTRYTCLPAFKFQWVAEAEKAYEEDIAAATPGIHMSESSDGELWKEFPSLRPVSCLHLFADPDNKNPREQALADRAKDLFFRAQACGMTVSTAPAGTAIRTYAVKLLPAELRPDKTLFRNLYSESDTERLNAIQEEIIAIVDSSAQTLLAKISDWTGVPADRISASLSGTGVTFAEERLRSLHEVYSCGADPAPDDWFERLAVRFLRKKPDTMYELEGSILVMEKLIQLVEAKK